MKPLLSIDCISNHDLTVLIMNTIGHNPEQMINQLLTRPSTEDMLNLLKVYDIESNLELKKCRSDNSIIFAHRTFDGIRDCPDYEDEKPTDYIERINIGQTEGQCCKEQ